MLAADGELPKRRLMEVETHLQSCWTCRERMRSFEETVAGFVRARNQELQSQIPPCAGPRALLRARLARASAENSGRWPRQGMAWRLMTAVSCAFVLTATAVVFELTVKAEGPRPNARVTPGETRPITVAEVCSRPEAEVVVKNISPETRRKVLETYGIKREGSGEFEVDYLITPDLGGVDSVRNLWPQPYSTRWNAKMKDQLEQRLHDMVCAGRMELPMAQRVIAQDWIGAYKKFVLTPGSASPPSPPVVR